MVKVRHSHRYSKKTVSQGMRRICMYPRERHCPITAEIVSLSNFFNGINYIFLVNPS